MNPARLEETRRTALRTVVAEANAIVEHGRSMLDLEEECIIPLIARIIPERRQRAFNFEVFKALGLDSRLHLVGMYEAVWELENESERKLFEEAIPSVTRSMIPRWKRLLYQPRTGALDSV